MNVIVTQREQRETFHQGTHGRGEPDRPLLKRILLVGNLGSNSPVVDGQSIKTQHIYKLLLEKTQARAVVDVFETQACRRSIGAWFSLMGKLTRCSVVIIAPAQDSLRYLFPLLLSFSIVVGAPLVYVVIGGWLAAFLKRARFYAMFVRRSRAVLVETAGLRESLVKLYGCNNVDVFPNFRMHAFTPRCGDCSKTFRVAFVARITAQKGIDAVFRLSDALETEFGKDANLRVEFYGPIQGDSALFLHEVNSRSCVRYGGIVRPEEVHHILDGCGVVVLPTEYKTEGFPGTILDAYIAGVPVVVSRWNYASEFVEHGVTGFIYDRGDEAAFQAYVRKLYLDRDLLLNLKRQAHRKSKEYGSEVAWGVLSRYI